MQNRHLPHHERTRPWLLIGYKCVLAFRPIHLHFSEIEVATDIFFFIIIEKVIIKNDYWKENCVAYELCFMHRLLIGFLNVGIALKIEGR